MKQNYSRYAFVVAAIAIMFSTTLVFATSSHHFQRLRKGIAFTSDTFEEITGVSDTNSLLVLSDTETSGVQSMTLLTKVDGVLQPPVYIGVASQLSSTAISDNDGNYSVTQTVNSVTIDLSSSVADDMYLIVAENGWTGVIQGYAVTFDFNSSVDGSSSMTGLFPVFYALELAPAPQQITVNVPSCTQIYTDCQLAAINNDDLRKEGCDDLHTMVHGAMDDGAWGAAAGGLIGTWGGGLPGGVAGGLLGGILGLIVGPADAYFGCTSASEKQYDIDVAQCKRAYRSCVRLLNPTYPATPTTSPLPPTEAH